MHDALANALFHRWSGVITRCLLRIDSKHATIPITYTLTSLRFIYDIKTMTGRAQVGADAAAKAGLLHLIPEITRKEGIETVFYSLQCAIGNQPFSGKRFLHLGRC